MNAIHVKPDEPVDQVMEKVKEKLESKLQYDKPYLGLETKGDLLLVNIWNTNPWDAMHPSAHTIFLLVWHQMILLVSEEALKVIMGKNQCLSQKNGWTLAYFW